MGWSGAEEDAKAQRNVSVLISSLQGAAEVPTEPGRSLCPGDGWGR